jgi:hypothetical protein
MPQSNLESRVMQWGDTLIVFSPEGSKGNGQIAAPLDWWQEMARVILDAVDEARRINAKPLTNPKASPRQRRKG